MAIIFAENTGVLTDLRDPKINDAFSKSGINVYNMN